MAPRNGTNKTMVAPKHGQKFNTTNDVIKNKTLQRPQKPEHKQVEKKIEKDNIIDPYLIPFQNLNLKTDKFIGKGGFGVVFFGNLNETIPIAAKKIYKLQFESSALKEMELLQKLDSKHVVKYYGYCETEDFLYIILEQMYCNLFQFLVGTPNLQLDQKIEIILEIAQCIDCLHQQNIIHLDVKSSNILMNEDGSIIKIADFGISKVKKTDETEFTVNTNLGTVGYQAPEIFNGDFGPHSDIYSFGIMMFEIVFQTSPYTNEELSDDDFKKSVKKGKRPNLEQFDTLIDEKLTMLIDLMKQCWDLKKNQRPTAAEIIESLNSIYNLKIK
jgi:serine/threonine protein kinase